MALALKRFREKNVEFVPFPPSYYELLRNNDEFRNIDGIDIDDLEAEGILIDKEGDTYLLQKFLKPISDRPFFLYEIVQRVNGYNGFALKNINVLKKAEEMEDLKGLTFRMTGIKFCPYANRKGDTFYYSVVWVRLGVRYKAGVYTASWESSGIRKPGIWSSAEPVARARDIRLAGCGNRGDIVVRCDMTGIPHLFAGNDYDLYFAQGFVTARDRLWQMELQVRTASGRLSELFGRKVLAKDMFYRRLGLAYASERALDSVFKDPVTKTMLQGYSDGVNAYIHQLSRSSYPLEYKLFDCKPEEWRPLNSLLILKLMAEDLTGGEREFNMTNTRLRFGRDTVTELFTVPNKDEEPVIPGHPSRQQVSAPGPLKAEVKGSNNWAVSGIRSANGYPLLANDPHLKLTLPSIWYEIQMKSPGVNVYGVSIPGVPAVVIGFNEEVAWGMTNAAVDVVDWYHIRFKDPAMEEYQYDGKWEQSRIRVEKYRLPGGKVVYDTICYTRQGPVVYDGGTHKKSDLSMPTGPLDGFALRWTMHDTSNDLKGFYLLNRARDYEQYRVAVSYFCCPAQSFVFADKEKDIAMTVSGKFPIRDSGKGAFILDGSLPADNWRGWIPMDQTPFIKNPERGFVSSANQVLTTPDYPYFVPGNYSLPYRARRINSRLANMKSVTVDSFRVLQSDNYSEMAAETLPVLLHYLDRGNVRDGDEVIEELVKWDFRFEKDSKAASIFTIWWDELNSAIWKDDMNNKDIPLTWPDYRKTAYLVMHDTASHWIDDITTAKRESLRDIVNASFQRASYILRKRLGPFGDGWAWGNARPCAISYIGNIPAFGIQYNDVGGAPNTINALSPLSGPSWRMVVTLGPVVRGYGIFPGGESGNPGSYYYDNLFQPWDKGLLNELFLLDSAGDGHGQIRYTLTFKQ